MSNPFSSQGMPDAYWGMIQTSVAKYGGDPMKIGTVMVLEAGGTNYTTGQLQSGSFNPNAVSPAGAQGLMQFMPATGVQYGLDPNNKDPNSLSSPFNPQASINAATQMINAKGVGAYNPGDPNYATRDFANVYTAAGGNDPNVLSQIQSSQASSTQGGTGISGAKGYAFVGGPGVAATAGNLPDLSSSVSASEIDALNPHLYLPNGLAIIPWYKDPSLLTGNKQARQSVVPVVFKVMLKRDNKTYLPSNATASNPRPADPTPLEVRLNCSMKTFNISSKHNFHPQQTRTGWHITMWGMQADMIEGQCSTGVFMNQMGLTNLFSTSYVSEGLKQSLMAGQGYIWDSNPASTGYTGQVTSQSTGAVAGSPVTTPTSYDSMFTARGIDPSSALRVAAQDAFVEFLSLFKMNGTVWLQPNGLQDKHKVSAFSSTTGLSNVQMDARNNDVMTRGYVEMNFKNTRYLGFFKQLSWSQDAASPFSWNFNFTFQVEKTISKLYLPSR